MEITTALPLLAGCFALPQFLPQLKKISRTGDVAGLTLAWPSLTAINNAAWIVYFLSVGYGSAIVPNAVVVLTSVWLARSIAHRTSTEPTIIIALAGWATVLAFTAIAGGPAALSIPLTVAFLVQSLPSVWSSYTTKWPTGVSAATWSFVGLEMACWLAFALARHDAALTVLGASGITISTLMVSRALHTSLRLARMKHLALSGAEPVPWNSNFPTSAHSRP